MVSSAAKSYPWLPRASRIAAAVVALVGSGLGLLLSLYVAALTCDEGCSDPPTNWHDDATAWQWHGQFALAGVATLLVVYALVRAIIGRRPWRALLASAVLWAAWWAFVTA